MVFFVFVFVFVFDVVVLHCPHCRRSVCPLRGSLVFCRSRSRLSGNKFSPRWNAESNRELGNTQMEKDFFGVHIGYRVFLPDLLYLPRGWVSSLRSVFFVIVLVFSSSSSLSSFCFSQCWVARVCFCSFSCVSRSCVCEDEKQRGREYGNTHMDTYRFGA